MQKFWKLHHFKPIFSQESISDPSCCFTLPSKQLHFPVTRTMKAGVHVCLIHDLYVILGLCTINLYYPRTYLPTNPRTHAPTYIRNDCLWFPFSVIIRTLIGHRSRTLTQHVIWHPVMGTVEDRLLQSLENQLINIIQSLHNNHNVIMSFV